MDSNIDTMAATMEISERMRTNVNADESPNDKNREKIKACERMGTVKNAKMAEREGFEPSIRF